MDVKDLNEEELYQYVLPILLEINNSYLYLMFDDETLKEIFSKFIYDATKQYEKNISYSTFIKDIIIKKYENIISEIVKEKPMELIDNYVKLNYKDDSDFQEIVNFLRNFTDFLKSLSDNENIELIFEVVKNNTIINTLLKEVVNKIINDKKYRYLKDNPRLETLIDVYTILNQIDLEQFAENRKVEVSDYKISDFFQDGYLDMEKLYSQEIRKKNLLTYQEEIELGRRARNGDKEAINMLVEHNLRLVETIAKRYSEKGLSFDDLRQEGSLGLTVAASKFDPDKGYKFSTYAGWWINQYIQRAIEDKGNIIRIPVHMRSELRKYSKLKDKLWSKLGHEPSCYEMQNEYNMTLDYVDYLEQLLLEPISLDKPITSDSEDYSLKENLISETKDFTSNIDTFDEILKGVNLTVKEKDVLIRYYKYGETDNKIGIYYNITRQRVAQIRGNAIAKIKRNPKKRAELAIYAEELSIVKNMQMESTTSFATIIKDVFYKVEVFFENNSSKIITLLKNLNFNKTECLCFVLDFGFKMAPRLIYKYSLISKNDCLNTLNKINSNFQALNEYINNSSQIITELNLETENLEFQKIMNDKFEKSSFAEKIKLRVSYYFAFPNISRFIYILKESNFEIEDIVFLVLRYIFDFDDTIMKLKGYTTKRSFNYIDKNCLLKIKDSCYIEEICNYLKNPDTVLEELQLIELKEKQFIKKA